VDIRLSLKFAERIRLALFLKTSWLAAALAVTFWAMSPVAAAKKKEKKESALDEYVRQAMEHTAEDDGHTAGSLWSSASEMADLGRDVRASRVNDLVTIVVAENASAVSSGTVKTSRASSANNSITSLVAPKSPGGAMANLLNTTGSTSLDGQGTTTRTTTLNATLTARVVKQLPNGYLVVEGSKLVHVNGERQVVTVRGVVRPADLAVDNSIQSNRLAQMEVDIDGKGVVNDAIHRPFFLYRILLGLLPF
jgi:flagellar L-ring protein precursor FlgH